MKERQDRIDCNNVNDIDKYQSNGQKLQFELKQIKLES